MNILLIEYNPFQPAHTPISLGYLAATLKKLDFQVEILNLGSDSRMSQDSFVQSLKEFRPSLIGFSAYQRNLFLLQGMAALVKSVLPDCGTALGGPQATFLPTTALASLPSVDFVCRAEGESALLDLARRRQAGEACTDIPGWSGRGTEGSLWDGPIRESVLDLDEYPSPYLDETLVVRTGEEAILLASRGCPYRCAFCYTPSAFGNRIRHHSMDRVLEEIRWISRRGVRRFWFADPSFTFDRTRVHTLLEALLTAGSRVEMWMETRVDLVNKELLATMKRAGVHTIAYGLESACPHVLQKIHKPLSLDQAEAAIRLAQEAGIEVELFAQYGLPGETQDDARNTLAFVRKNRVKIRGNTNPQQMQIYFGTEIQRDPQRFGIHPFPEARPAYLSVGARYETEWMRSEEIENIGRLWKAASEDGGNTSFPEPGETHPYARESTFPCSEP